MTTGSTKPVVRPAGYDAGKQPAEDVIVPPVSSACGFQPGYQPHLDESHIPRQRQPSRAQARSLGGAPLAAKIRTSTGG
ncbi:hypothetical protein GGTG_08704 [Gaeumannomyces tritici R3-111a-1]|uniref:Uncharacterized protein n=1 Tax=Gaeumannomyces tritici (strain R3-111a-1) TaxID=644352 RepID=J3P5B5_GAET3|nr:hypothetical protein GGTG_08704 [Gaeumannomyces tritici R3-111a-1]EJT74866.1 hypothetical protein GGTG_08704 [Gaeumannomyces tritici R3-111a-1]